MLHLRTDIAYLSRYLPEKFLGERAGAEVDYTEREHVERLLAYLKGIVPALEKVLLVKAIPYHVKLLYQLVLVAVELLRILPGRERCSFEYIENQHRMVGRERAPGLGHDVGLWQGVLLTCIYDGINCIVGILLYRVVHRAFGVRRAGAVVVHAQAAAYIDIVDGKTHFGELHVELHSLAQGILYAAYLCNLAAYMEVYQLQPASDVIFLEVVDGLEQLRGVEAELRLVAPRFLPFARAGIGELDADADIGGYLQTPGHGVNQLQLVELFHYEDYAASHLVGQHSQLHIVLVLVSVADDKCVLGDIGGQHGMKLGLGAGLQADVEFLAVRHNLLHHRAHLVHLYRVNHKILRLVAILLGRMPETVRDFLHTVVEDVREAQEHRRGDVLKLELIHHLAQIHRHEPLAGGHADMAAVVNREILPSPSGDVVKLGTVFNTPFSHLSNGEERKKC